MLTPERRFQIEEEIRARRAARIAADLPPDSSDPEKEEEEEEQQPVQVEDPEEDEAYVEANRQFIQQERVVTDALFAELDAEKEAEADAELRLPPMYPEPGTEIVDIPDED